MEQQVQQYVDSLFLNAPHTIQVAELREEILQNTLDRYRDALSEGKTPEDAYRAAVSGIGDIRLILESVGCQPVDIPRTMPGQSENKSKRMMLIAAGVVCCILSLVPVILLEHTNVGNTVGPALMFVMIAVGVGLLIYQSKYSGSAMLREKPNEPAYQKEIRTAVSTVGLVIYFIISFVTKAWYISWLVFPIMACVMNVVNACFDLKRGE